MTRLAKLPKGIFIMSLISLSKRPSLSSLKSGIDRIGKLRDGESHRA